MRLSPELSAISVSDSGNPSHWQVDDVAKWAKDNFSSEVAESFQKSEIDGTRLLSMSPTELEENGVNLGDNILSFIQSHDELYQSQFCSTSHGALTPPAIFRQDSTSVSDYSSVGSSNRRRKSFSKHRHNGSHSKVSDLLEWDNHMEKKESIRGEIQAIYEQATPLMYAILCGVVLIGLNFIISLYIPSWNNRKTALVLRERNAARAAGILDISEHYWSPTMWMDEYQVVLFVTFWIWFICIFSGITMELTFGAHIVQLFEENVQYQWAWIYAQAFFPIICVSAAVSDSPMAIPVLVLGMFKLGFPEISAYLHRSTFSDIFSFPWLADWLNGFGTLCHHSAATMIFLGLVLHVFPLERFIAINLIIVLLQHAAVILRFLHRRVHIVTVLSLEIWFQLESIPALCTLPFSPAGQNIFLLLALMLMIESHWMYLVAGVIEFFGLGYEAKHPEKSQRSSNENPLFNAFVPFE